ncbi:MAG: hypothetical protein LIP18_04140, partial [Planctomycetes bacterium]|nr:hypothetical protein [Planctomycetota bacterium]
MPGIDGLGVVVPYARAEETVLSDQMDIDSVFFRGFVYRLWRAGIGDDGVKIAELGVEGDTDAVLYAAVEKKEALQT